MHFTKIQLRIVGNMLPTKQGWPEGGSRETALILGLMEEGAGLRVPMATGGGAPFCPLRVPLQSQLSLGLGLLGDEVSQDQYP